MQLNFECRMLYGAIVVILWTCYGALQIVVLVLLLLLWPVIYATAIQSVCYTHSPLMSKQIQTAIYSYNVARILHMRRVGLFNAPG